VARGEGSAFAPRGSGRAGEAAAGLLLAAVTFAGWRELWFLTDDAFITFRYISNRMLGHGYVWNAAPFHPVEGYSNFLWMVLLDASWSWLGLMPPRTSTVLSLLFGYATLWQAWRLGVEMDLPPEFEPRRRALVLVALAAVVSSHTFLVWLSSGLETSLFSFLMVAWTRYALRLARQPGPGTVAGLAVVAALAALTRPDGLLLVPATMLLAARARLEGRGRAVALLPLVLVAAHLLWRRGYYGEWLPNTYYAKYVAPWPAAGVRYAAAFILDYALWAWLALVAAAVVRRGWRLGATASLCVATLLAHFAYFTLVVGGDHFEYRVYHHLVPLLFLSGAWAAAWSGAGTRVAPALFITWAVLSLVLPWTRHAVHQGLGTRASTFGLAYRLAPSFPAAVRPYVATVDSLETWLVKRSIAVRHREHQVFFRDASAHLPTREEGERLHYPDTPVWAASSVGIGAWTMPHVAVLDTLGLNDYFVARTPVADRRAMAHDRHPPPGYVECFEPNIAVQRRALVHTARRTPLTAERVRRCEVLAGLFVDYSEAAPWSTAGRARLASGIDLGTADDHRFELGPGWYARERWGVASGRWSGPEARVTLERRGEESGVLVDLFCPPGGGPLRGRLEVNGRALSELPARAGRHRILLDLASVPERRVEVRLRVEDTFVPRERDLREPDARRLGVFVHEVRLTDRAQPDTVDLGRAGDGDPGLGEGWWTVETWPDGSAGRWTSGEAVLALSRPEGERSVIVDASFDHPDGATSGEVAIGDIVAARFREPNGRTILTVPLPAAAPPVFRLRLRVERPFVPRTSPSDGRTLGMFVHSVHTADDAEKLLRVPERAGHVVVELAAGGERWAAGRIEVGGGPARDYVVGAEEATVRVPVPAPHARFLKVRVVADLVTPVAAASPSPGVVVRSIRFEPDPGVP
jgi:arabinofuranosyltransferase